MIGLFSIILKFSNDMEGEVMERIPSSRGHIYVLGSHAYVLNNEKNGRIHLRCKHHGYLLLARLQVRNSNDVMISMNWITLPTEPSTDLVYIYLYNFTLAVTTDLGYWVMKIRNMHTNQGESGDEIRENRLKSRIKEERVLAETTSLRVIYDEEVSRYDLINYRYIIISIIHTILLYEIRQYIQISW